MEKFDGIISLFLACVEVVIVVNLLIFAEKNKTNRLAIGFIGLLFGYQFIEFLICSAGLRNQLIIYLAFFDITLLPPLGLYIVLEYSGKLKKYHKYIFLPAYFFVIYYLFTIDQFAVAKCTVLYAAYHYPLGQLYAVLYYLPILAAMIILNKKWGSDTDPRQKKNTRLFFFGYLFTFLPAMIIALLVPSFIMAVESLLCKMAFIMAVFLFIFVLKNKTVKNPE